MTIQEEENNYPKAFLLTGIILGIVMALCYFIVFITPPKLDDGTGGILVNYGTVDEGSGTNQASMEEPSVAEKANKQQPDKVTPAPPTEQKTQVENSDKDVVTQNTEDAPEVAAKSKKPNNASVAQPNKPAAKAVVNQNALYKGKTNNASGTGDGTTNTPGNQGKPNGSNLSNNYNGTGSGNGGLALENRSWVSRPTVDDARRRVGRIVVEIHVDKNGNVLSATAGAKGTTITDYDLLTKCENAAKNAKLNASADAPETQVGYITFVFKVQ